MNIRQQMLQPPNLVSSLRLLMAPLLFVFAFLQMEYWFIGALIFAGLTDVLDGFLARKMNLISPLGARLDSWGDFTIYSTMAICAWILWPEVTQRELTHYAKFLSLTDGTVDIGSVVPLVKNPSIAAMPRDVAAIAEFSNAIYSYLFVILDRLLARDQADRHHLVGILYGVMVGLLAPVSRYLTTKPAGNGEFWGPPFGYYEFSTPDGAEDELRRLGAAITAEHAAIGPALRHLDQL